MRSRIFFRLCLAHSVWSLGYVVLAEIIVGLQFRAAHRRELLTYLLLGTLSLLSSLILEIATEISLPRLALAVSPYAILFGAFQRRLGQGLSRHPIQRRSFRVCGVIEKSLREACSLAPLSCLV